MSVIGNRYINASVLVKRVDASSCGYAHMMIDNARETNEKKDVTEDDDDDHDTD
jgi:hypothetical protein